MTNPRAWVGTPGSGIPEISTTSLLERYEWERLGWKIAPLYAAPPQQPKRVDFSAFRELAESWKVMVEPDPDKQAWAMHHANCCCADELIALTYQQESKP